jgi:predicted secreted protein
MKYNCNVFSLNGLNLTKRLMFIFICFFPFLIYAKALPIYSSKPIFISKHQSSFIISLAATPGTGFHWVLQNKLPEGVAVKQLAFTKATSPLIGASGSERWLFSIDPKKIKIKMFFSLIFIYERPWNHLVGKKITFRVMSLSSVA